MRGFLPTLGLLLLLTLVTAFLLLALMLDKAPLPVVDLIESVLVTLVFVESALVTLEARDSCDPFELSPRLTLSTRRRPSVGLTGSRTLPGCADLAGTGFRSTDGVIDGSRGLLGVLGGVFFGLELASKTLIRSEIGVRPIEVRRDMMALQRSW